MLYVPVLGYVQTALSPVARNSIACPGWCGWLSVLLSHPLILWVPLRRLDPAWVQVDYDSRSQVPWGGSQEGPGQGSLSVVPEL